MENWKRIILKNTYLPPATKVEVYQVEYKEELMGKIAFR